MAQGQYSFLNQGGQAPGRRGFPPTSVGWKYTSGRPPQARQASAFPEGFAGARIERQTEWWPPPPEFSLYSSHGSKLEWQIYRSLLLILGTVEGDGWYYQVPVAGGRSTKGGSVIDFLVDQTEGQIGIRLQSDRYHTAVDLARREEDLNLRANLEKAGVTVVDIWEHYIKDTLYTGAQALYWTRRALSGIQAAPPASSRVSRQRR